MKDEATAAQASPSAVDRPRRKRRGLRLLQMILLSILIFFILALGEDYARTFWTKWQARRDLATSDTRAAQAVRAYNDTLVDAYKRSQPSLMNGVATENEVERVRLFMAYNYYEKKRVMRTTLKRLDVQKVKVDRRGRRATVTTSEDWAYHYVEKKSGKKLSPVKPVHYRATYVLEKRADRWLVSSLKID